MLFELMVMICVLNIGIGSFCSILFVILLLDCNEETLIIRG